MRSIAAPREEHGTLFAAAEVAFQPVLVLHDVTFPVRPGRGNCRIEPARVIEATISVPRVPDQGVGTFAQERGVFEGCAEQTGG